MSLLVDIATSALDPGYEQAARRRQAGNSARPVRPGLLLVAGVLATALLVAVAAAQTHAQRPANDRSRAALAAAVDARTRAIDGLARRLAGLRAATASLRDQSLASSTAGAALSRRLASLELAAGLAPVAGPGLEVRLADADAAPDATGSNRVLDRDLQDVVNALWAAGAEAVAVNGQRLTAQSAIRQAGEAILVDFRPLRPPYVVTAIGDPVALDTGFGAGPAASRLRSLVQLYGLHFGYHQVRHASLPAATDVALRYARPVPAAARRTP